MDASKLPKGQSVERTEGRPYNLPGIYKHKPSGNTLITSDGDEGVVQADALMSPVWKDQWERVGDVPSRVELKEMREAQLQKDLKSGATKPEKKAVAEAVA